GHEDPRGAIEIAARVVRAQRAAAADLAPDRGDDRARGGRGAPRRGGRRAPGARAWRPPPSSPPGAPTARGGDASSRDAKLAARTNTRSSALAASSEATPVPSWAGLPSSTTPRWHA